MSHMTGDPDINPFAQLLSKPVGGEASKISQRLGVDSTAEAISVMAQARPDKYTVSPDGEIKFKEIKFNVNITERYQLRDSDAGVKDNKWYSESRQLTVRLEVEQGVSPDQAKVKVHVPAMEEADEVRVTAGLRKQLELQLNAELKNLGFPDRAVTGVGGARPSLVEVNVDQASIQEGPFRSAQAKVADIPDHQRSAERTLQAAKNEALAPEVTKLLKEVAAIDLTQNPQDFAVRLKELGLGDQVDMIKVVSGDPEALKK